jgi:hypothetical protein
MQQYVSLLDTLLTGAPQVNFRRHLHRLSWFSDMNDNDITAGDYIIIELYQIIDPEDISLVFIMICL